MSKTVKYLVPDLYQSSLTRESKIVLLNAETAH